MPYPRCAMPPPCNPSTLVDYWPFLVPLYPLRSAVLTMPRLSARRPSARIPGRALAARAIGPRDIALSTLATVPSLFTAPPRPENLVGGAAARGGGPPRRARGHFSSTPALATAAPQGRLARSVRLHERAPSSTHRGPPAAAAGISRLRRLGSEGSNIRTVLAPALSRKRTSRRSPCPCSADTAAVAPVSPASSPEHLPPEHPCIVAESVPAHGRGYPSGARGHSSSIPTITTAAPKGRIARSVNLRERAPSPQLGQPPAAAVLRPRLDT